MSPSFPFFGFRARLRAEVTHYQWLVLIIASAGWVFDVYETQIFNITAPHLLPGILQGTGDAHGWEFWKDVFFGVLLLGGATGGLLFGMMADKIGRKPTLIATILMYSVFSGLIYFAQNLWHVGILLFFVSMGTGGEWAVAASLVAEVFPAKARTHASGIFHATSVSGTWFATSVAILVGAHWRYAYLAGILPALLVAWVLKSVHEPPRRPLVDHFEHAARIAIEQRLRRGPTVTSKPVAASLASCPLARCARGSDANARSCGCKGRPF